MKLRKMIIGLGIMLMTAVLVTNEPGIGTEAATSYQTEDSFAKLIHDGVATYYTAAEMTDVLGSGSPYADLRTAGIAQTGDTLVLLKDYYGVFFNELTSGTRPKGAYGICKGITLDLNGHTIGGLAAGDFSSGTLICKNGTITRDIDDCPGVTDDAGTFVWENLTVLGSSYISGHNVTIKSGYYQTGSFNGEAGTISIEGGYFTGDPSGIVNSSAGYIVKNVNVVHGDKTYLYHVVKGYKLFVNANGGTCSESLLGYAEDDEEPIVLPDAYKDGKHITGWYTAASGGTLVGHPGDKIRPDADITIYAQWHNAEMTYALDGITNDIVAICTADVDWCKYHASKPAESKVRLSVKANTVVSSGAAYMGASFDPSELPEFNRATGLAVSTLSLTYGVVTSGGYVSTTTANSGAAGNGKAPVNPGLYVAILKIGDVEITERFRIKNTIDEEDTLVNTDDANAGGEPSYINREYGHIIYTARDHMIKYGTDADDHQVNTTYLDLTTEKIITDLTIACYSLDGGKSWKTGNIDAINSTMVKNLNNQTKIKIATAYDNSKKKPTDAATVISFGTIKRRPASTKFTVNYYLCRDDYGMTNGQWCLTVNNRGVDLDEYEIGISADGKNIGTDGYGVWPAGGIWGTCGGVWISDIPSSGKAGKEVYFYRKLATEDTPSSKPVKITVTTVSKAPQIKVDYKKETIKLKDGLNIYFGETMPEFNEEFSMKRLADAPETYADYVGRGILKITKNQAKKAIDISKYITETSHKIYIWQSASAKKAPTAKQIISVAARAGAPTAEACVTVTNGTAKLNKDYEIYDTKTKKWVSSIPKLTKTTTFSVRHKATAKGGKENDTTYAAGVSAQLTLTYGVVDEAKKKSGVVSATVTSE